MVLHSDNSSKSYLCLSQWVRLTHTLLVSWILITMQLFIWDSCLSWVHTWYFIFILVNQLWDCFSSIPGAEISRLLFINFPAVSYLSACLMNLQYKKVCFFTESEILWKLSLGVALTFSIIIFFYCFSSSLGLSIFFRPMSALLFASVKRKYWNFTYECYQISKGKQLLISFNCLR